MSKQSEAKERQGYNPKPPQNVCRTCNHFTFDMDWPKWMKDGCHGQYLTPGNQVETNLRCHRGGFTVKKLARCNIWMPKG